MIIAVFLFNNKEKWSLIEIIASEEEKRLLQNEVQNELEKES